MKKKIALGISLTLSVLTFAPTYAANVSSPAMPTGTLNITGKIIDKGCTFEAKNVIIQLAPVVASAFTAVGDMGPKSDAVNFNLTGCPANTTLSFTVAGTQGANVNTFAMATESTNATGFDLILYGPNTATGIVKPNTSVTLTPDASGNYTGILSAQLRAKVAAPTVGKVDTTLTYTLAYN